MHVILEKGLCISNKRKAVSHLKFSTYLSCISFILIWSLLMMRRGILTPLFSQVIDLSQILSYIRDIWLPLVWVAQGRSSNLSDGCGAPWPLQCWCKGYHACRLTWGVCLRSVCGVLCLLDGSLLLLCCWAVSDKIWINKYLLLS